MLLKPVKFGMKLYALCEVKTGYACSLILYNNFKKESNVEMISRLTENYKMESLKSRSVFACGTMRDNR